MTPFKPLLAALSLSLAAGSAHAVTRTQTCNASLSPSRPDSQYQISGDGREVSDLKTGLVWQRCLDGASWNADTQQCDGRPTGYDWNGALTRASAQTGGWRLPNINELRTLLETSCKEPALNQSVFTLIFDSTISGRVLSATPYIAGESGGDSVWIVDFYSGEDTLSDKSGYANVRFVRDAAR